MRLTFKNGNAEEVKTAKKHLANRKADFIFYMNHGLDDEGADEKAKKEWEKAQLGPFNEYGLCCDYVAPGTFKADYEGYFRYQIAYGGPTEEFRFYYSTGGNKPYRIEFVYLNWGTGIGLDVTGEEWAQWLWDQFYDTETIKTEEEKATKE